MPALYIADDALLQRISDYVKNGGHVVMTFKSGFANENSAVRWVRAPGPLREAAGFSYQEFSNLEQPLALKGDPFHVAGGVSLRIRFATGPSSSCRSTPSRSRTTTIRSSESGLPSLRTNSAQARCSTKVPISPTRSRPPYSKALSRNSHSREATSRFPPPVHVQHGVNRLGKRLHYYFNYSAAESKVTYAYGAGTDLLNGKSVTKSAELTLAPWDLAIVEEN